MRDLEGHFDGTGRRAQILLIDDDPEDAALMRRALERGRLPTDLAWAADGEQALARLRREGPYADATAADLVLLDLNMPRLSGYDVLAAVRRDPALTRLPVIVLTTSRSDDDVVRSYELGANAYLTKPSGLSGYAQMVAAIGDFWFGVAVLPPATG